MACRGGGGVRSGFVLVYYVSLRTLHGRVVSDASLRGAISSGAAFQETVGAILNVVSVSSLLGALATVAVIALVRLDRRPVLGLDEVAPATLNSLPSGHTTAAFSAVAALVIVLPS